MKERRKIKTENSIRFRFFFGFETKIPNPIRFCFRVFRVEFSFISDLTGSIRFRFGSNRFRSVSFRIQPVPFDTCFRGFGSFRFRVENWNRLEKKRISCIPNDDNLKLFDPLLLLNAFDLYELFIYNLTL